MSIAVKLNNALGALAMGQSKDLINAIKLARRFKSWNNWQKNNIGKVISILTDRKHMSMQVRGNLAFETFIGI